MPIQAENVNLATKGQIGKKYIYWNIRGEQFKRAYKIPDDPKTFDQRTQRNKFYAASQMWRKLTAEQKKEWEKKVLKSQYVMTAYNFFIRKKIKEIKKMVKKVTHGSAVLSDGANVINIAEIQLDKTILIYNSFCFGSVGPPGRLEGILDAYFSDATHITAHCENEFSVGTITLHYSIVEFV